MCFLPLLSLVSPPWDDVPLVLRSSVFDMFVWWRPERCGRNHHHRPFDNSHDIGIHQCGIVGWVWDTP